LCNPRVALQRVLLQTFSNQPSVGQLHAGFGARVLTVLSFCRLENIGYHVDSNDLMEKNTEMILESMNFPGRVQFPS
jgi:hypothetical protein